MEWKVEEAMKIIVKWLLKKLSYLKVWRCYLVGG